MPTPQDLHIDRALTDMSVRYRNEAMIGLLACPIIPVKKRSDKYFVYNQADAYTRPDDQIGPKGLPNELDWSLSANNYSVVDHALSDWLPYETIENADTPIQPEADTNEFLNEALDLAEEYRIANLLFNSSSYAASNVNALTGSATWDNTGADPVGNIMTSIEKCFKRANTLVFGIAAWKVLRTHPAILDAVKAATRYQGSPGGVATRDEVASLFEVDQILIGRARYNTARMGQTASYDRVWGGHCAALFVQKAPGVKSLTFAATFCEMQKRTYTYFDPKRGTKGAEFIKVAWNSAEQVIANNCGYFIENVTSQTL